MIMVGSLLVRSPRIRTRSAASVAIGFLLVLLVGGRATLARAEKETPKTETPNEAKRHFIKAEAHFSLGEFAPALENYRRAHLVQPHPALLFNMAQCQRLLGQPREAVFLLRRFLASSPPPAQRKNAEAILDRIEAELARTHASPSSQPARSSSKIPTTKPEVTSSSRLVGPDSTRNGAREQGSVSRPKRSDTPFAGAIPISVDKQKNPAPSRRPFYKTWWFWTLVGGAVAVTVTATAVGVTATRESPPEGTLNPIDYR